MQQRQRTTSDPSASLLNQQPENQNNRGHGQCLDLHAARAAAAASSSSSASSSSRALQQHASAHPTAQPAPNPEKTPLPGPQNSSSAGSASSRADRTLPQPAVPTPPVGGFHFPRVWCVSPFVRAAAFGDTTGCAKPAVSCKTLYVKGRIWRVNGAVFAVRGAVFAFKGAVSPRPTRPIPLLYPNRASGLQLGTYCVNTASVFVIDLRGEIKLMVHVRCN